MDEFELRPAEPLCFLRGTRTGVPVDHAGKTLRQHADGTLSKLSNYSAGALAAVTLKSAHDADSFFAAVEWAADQPGLYWVRGRLTAAGIEANRQTGVVRRTKYASQDKRLLGDHRSDPACFEEFDRRGHMIDVDSSVLDELRAAGVDIFKDPGGAAHFVAALLPDWVRRGPLAWSLSGSSGVKGAHDARFHFFFWTNLPIAAGLLKALLAAHNETRPDIANKLGKPALLDLSVLHAVQPHYLAAPLVYDESSSLVHDPLTKRWGRIAGELPYSPLPLVDLFAGGGARAQPARVQRRVTGHTAVRTASGDTATLGALAKRAAMPKSSHGCECLIGDGPGLHGFHEPTRQAIFWRLVELTKAGSADAISAVEPYLGHLQRAIDAAPKAGRDPHSIAARRDILELRRMATEGLGRAAAVVAKRAKNTSLLPLFPDREVPLADAQADLREFLQSFFNDAVAYHGYHDGVRDRGQWWRENRGDATRGLLSHLRANTRFAGAPLYIAAHETGLAKSSGTQRHLAGIDLTKWRVLYFAPNHAACEQVRADLQKLDVDAFVLKGIGYEDDAGPICGADQQIKAFAERGKLALASHRETACTVCPLRANCAYLSQADEMRRPGVKILPHAFLQATIPGLSGKDAAPLFCVVLDEKFTDALKVTLSANWGETEKGSTSSDKWAREFAGKLADTPVEWGMQDTSLMKLAERAPAALAEYNDARSDARDDIRNDIKANGIDADFGYASLATRQHLKFIAHFCQLVRDQVDLGRATLQGVCASWRGASDGGRRLHLEIGYRALLPDFGCPVLALDATHDDRLTSAIFAERRFVDYGDSYHLAEPIPSLSEPKFRRVRARKPFERIIAVPDAPASKTRLGTSDLKPATYRRVPKKVREAGAAIVARPGAEFDVYPPRQRRDANAELIARTLRWFTEGARHDPSKRSYSAGIFGHKEQRLYMEAHAMFGANVLAGHHGIGTALNDWKDVERFAVVGVTRLDDEQLAKEVESFFALAPAADTPRMTQRMGEAGIRMRDGSGYPVTRATWGDERVDALARQIGEAQLEQELGRTRSVWRTADNPVTVLVLANAVIDRTFDAVLSWEQLARLTPFDTAASAGVVPDKAHQLDKLLPGLFTSPRAAKDEILELRNSGPDAAQNTENTVISATRKNDARGYIENIHIGASVVFAGADLAPIAGVLPHGVCDRQLVPHDVVLKRAKDNDRVCVLADPTKPAALERYAAALGKKLCSARLAPTPVCPPIVLPAPAPALDCSLEQDARPVSVPRVPATADAGGWFYPWDLPAPNPPPWPELPVAPTLYV